MTNEDILPVAYNPSLSACWTFTLECESTLISDVTTDVVDICQHIFQAAGRFFLPRHLEFSLTEFENDICLTEIYNTDQLGVENKAISEEEGIEYEYFRDFITELVNELDGVGHFSGIEIEFACKIFVDGNDILVSRNQNDVYRWDHANDGVEYKPEHDPLRISISQVIGSSSNRPKYKVTVDLHSDIWYEESEIGARNRERLADFLRKLHILLTPTDVSFIDERASPFDAYYKIDSEEHDLPFETRT